MDKNVVRQDITYVCVLVLPSKLTPSAAKGN